MPHFIYINTPDASQATYFSHFVPLSVYGLMMKIIHILNSKLLWLLNYKGIQNWMHGEQWVCLLVQNCPICHPNGSVNKKFYPISNCNPLINWNHSKKYWLVENWDRGTKYIVCGFNSVNTLTKGGYEIILIKHYPNTYTEKANLVILDS